MCVCVGVCVFVCMFLSFTHTHTHTHTHTIHDIVVFGEGYGVTPASNSPISGASGGQAHRIYKQLLAYLGEENVIVVTEFFTSRTDSKTHEVLCNLVAPKVCAIMMSVFARSVVL